MIALLLSHSGFSSIDKHKRKTGPLKQMLATLKKILSPVPLNFHVYKVHKNCLKHIRTYNFSWIQKSPTHHLGVAKKLHIRYQEAKFRATVIQTTSRFLSGQALVTRCVLPCIPKLVPVPYTAHQSQSPPASLARSHISPTGPSPCP